MAAERVRDIVTDAANELGLYSGDISDPYASTDRNVLQLARLLKRVGRGLVRAYPWSHLTISYTFPTVDGTESYALPADFDRFVEQTAWNRTQQRPLLGPLSAQAWELVQARSSASANQSFRIFGGLFHVYATPTEAETIACEYISTLWVGSDGGDTPDLDAPESYLDALFFDSRLLVAELKLAYLSAKGFDTSAALAERDVEFARATGADGAAPVLGLSSSDGFRLIGDFNIPDSGVGS